MGGNECQFITEVNAQSNVTNAIHHTIIATMGQTARLGAMSYRNTFLVFTGCCFSLHQIMRAVSECAFLAMALKEWLIGTQNRRQKHTEIQPMRLA